MELSRAIYQPGEIADICEVDDPADPHEEAKFQEELAAIEAAERAVLVDDSTIFLGDTALKS